MIIGEIMESNTIRKIIAKKHEKEVERLRGDGWISVKERLPELYEDVLVYGKNFNHRWSNDTEPDRFYVARYCGDTCGWTIPGIGGLTITHWRPLPEPPRGENGENNEI
jgi:hypothetical protein